MSIAKKSVKWLVALFVIFALILTASVALGNVARASAEPEAAGEDTFIPLSVIAKGAVTNESYPNLLSSSNDREVTVEYYFDIPAAIENDLNTEMKFDIYMTLPDNSKVKPTNIEVNTAIASAVTMDALTNQAEEGYLDDAETAATEFAIELKPTHRMSELRGFTKSGTTYTLGNYFFKATYTVPASTDGVYSFGFGATSEVPANEALDSEDAITYVPEVTNVTTDTVMDGIDDVTAVSTGIFHVRSYIDVPVAVPGLIFDNTQQTAVVDKDGYAYVIGDLVNDIYPVFYHDQWPTGFSLVPETYIGGVEAQQSHATFALIDKDIYVWRIPDGNDGYTYSPDNYTVNWEIAKRSITVPVSAGNTYTYNGQEQSFEFSEDPLTDAAYITITGTPQTDVDEYTVTAALKYPASTYWAADANDTADKEYDFIINPALITVPTPADVTYTFNKTEQSFQWVATPDALITITGDSETDSGDYTVTASIPANYAWNDEGHTTADKTFPFVIAKKSVTVPSLEPSHFTYNGEEKSVSLVQAIADEGYIAERSTGTTWVATNAGEYAVKVGLQYPASTYWGDDTTDTEDKTLNWDISKVQITKPTPYDGAQYVYDSYNKQFMLDVVSAETGYYTVSNNIRKNAGTQTVTVSLKDKTNTQWADGTTANLEFTFTVQRRPVNLSVSADAASHVYGDTPANVSISATGIIDAFSCSYKAVCVDGEAPYAEYTPTQFNEGLNAGHYTLNPVYNDINGNYDVTVSEPFSYEITKKQVSIPKAVSGLTFNGSEQEGVVNDDNSSLYDLGDWDMDDFNLASGSAKGTAAGNYTATFALEDTDNTEWANAEAGEEITNKTIAWYIDYLLVTKPTATTTTYYYSGSEKTYAFASAGDSNRYTVANNKRTNAGTQTVTATLSNANYKWADGTTANLEFTFTIKKASVMAAACSLDNTFTYTGEEITCNFVSEGQQSYFTITGHKQTNVGTYTVTETLNDPNNYKWSHFPNVSDDEPTAPYVQENAFEITKKAVTIPTAVSGLEYTGSAQVGVIKTDGSFYTLYSGSDEETAVGNYSATYRLNSTTNSYWVGDGTDVADKTVEWSIAKKSITKPSISASYKIYNGTSQSYSGSGTGYTFTGSGTNAGEYPVTVTLTDKANSVWAGTDSAEDYSEADKLVINKKTVKLTLTESADSSVYGNAIATITAGINPDYAPINTADIGTVSYTAQNFQTNVVYTKADFETIHTAPVGNYILTAVCSVDNDNYSIDAQTLPYAITIRYITVPTVVDDTFDYDGNEHSIGFSNVDNDYVDITYDTQSAIGVYTNTTTVALKAAHAGNIAWDDDNHTTAAKTYTLTIEVVEVNFTIVPIFNNTQKTGTAATQIVLTALPEATTYRWFKFTGYTFGNNAAETVSLDMEGETIYANYTYGVGAGDADGDGVISSADVILLKRWNVGLDRAKKIADAATAWAKTDDSSVTSAVLYTALDANNNGAIRSNDVVAVREALATGRTYKVLVQGGIVKVAKANRVTVNSYEDLLGNIRLGNPVTLGKDIDAANEIFNEDSLIPVDIDLGAHRLTVKGFTLNTATAGATLKINNGTLYTVTGITVTAPNGNVVVASVNGYSYDGTVVNLAAYSESLHIEDSVAFYIYKAQRPGTTTDYADVHAFVADVYPENIEQATTQEITALNTTITTLANTRIGETAARMADIATIKADTERTEAQKAEDINALDVKKAILEVPIDTHVVVEAAAKLSADKIVVKAQSDTAAPAVTTFAIEVKNAEAEVVTVDISEVKDNTGDETVYVVSEVAISGASSQVEVVAGENTAADVKKYVAQIGTTSYETLQAAITAAQNADTIKLIADVADGAGIAIPDAVSKTITIDFNGKTYTVVGPAVGSTGTESQSMHWSVGANVTLKNGTFAVAEGATGVTMGMQSHGVLTVNNMTIDMSKVPFGYYGTYTGTYEKYSNLEKPVFNANYHAGYTGGLTITNSTITLPADSTKGVYTELANTVITDSTINGSVALSSDSIIPDVTVTNSTITKGVVAYFAADIVAENNGVWTIIPATIVTNEAELNAALADGVKRIILNADIEVTAPVVVDYEVLLDMNGKTIYNTTDIWSGNDWSLISVRTANGDLTITGDGTLSAKANDCYAIDVQDGANLVIENGTFIGNVSVVYICNGGDVTVNGGDFSLLQLYPDGRFLFNCLDADYKNGTANFTVTGGTYHNGFNPADNASEGAHTNYLANGYAAVEEDGVWTVIPATIVTNEAELKAAVAANAPYIVVGDDFSLASTISVSGGKDIVIDMNGYSITSTNLTLFAVYAGNSLEFTGNGNLTLNNTAKPNRAAMWIEGSTNVASVRESYLTLGEGVTLTSTGYGLVLYEVTGTNYCYGVVISVDGTITTSRNAAICAIGNIGQHDGDVVNGEPIAAISEINIGSTASLTAMNSAIYAAGFAVWNIESGAQLTGADAIYAKSGYLTIGDGVVLTATKDPATPYQYNGNGENPTGDGIVIDSCNYPGKAPVVNYTSALLDNITVAAEGAQKIATYWAVKSEAELNEAIAAKAPYIFIRDSFTVANQILIDYSLTIDGNNKTITATGEGSGYAIYVMYEAADGVAVNIQDLTIISTGRQVAFMTNCDYASTATLTNVDITCDGECIYSNGKMTVTATGCNFTHDGIYAEGKDAVYYSALIVGYAGEIVAENCTVTSFGNGASTFPSGGTITLRNTDITISESASSNANAGYALWARNEDYTNLPGYNCDSVINVHSGNITGELKLTDKYTGTHSKNVYDPIINIYGGTFDHDPTAYVADGYVATENDGVWTVVANEIEITTFAELKAAIADVNNGTRVNPTLVIANDIQFEEELTISKSLTILGDGEVKFIGYNAVGNYNDAFYINTSAADQTVTIQGIVFDHFCYYSDVANKTKATASGAKNGVSVITYAGACHSGTTLNIIGCEVIGTGRDMINVSSSLGCAGTINITDCTFDATDRLSGTLNMLSFYGKQAADLYVTIENCIFSEATEANTTWATTAIASFGNAAITVDGCTFEDCQVAIGIDNTFDRLFETVTYPVYVNTTCTLNDVTYVNCYFGYYEESIVASVDDVPEGAELASETAAALADNKNAAYGNYYEYDIVEGGTQGVDATYLVVKSYYVAA